MDRPYFLIQPDFAPFEVSGIDEWWNDFDLHVDYADSTADPNFDWATWYAKSLEMVKNNSPKPSKIGYCLVSYSIRNSRCFSGQRPKSSRRLYLSNRRI